MECGIEVVRRKGKIVENKSCVIAQETVISSHMKIYIEDDLPMMRIVCPRCDGRGKHDHPAFYYDVKCEECGGNNVVEVPDENRMSAELVNRLHDYYRDEAYCRAEQEAERRFGC